MRVMEALHGYLQTYGPLRDGRIGVDFLPPDAGGYALEAVPCEAWVKRYVDGGGVKQFRFRLCGRAAMDETVGRQLGNLGFYEDFARWLDERTADGDLPALGAGRRALKLEAVGSGHSFLQGTNTAQYQIECRLTYLQEKENTTWQTPL